MRLGARSAAWKMSSGKREKKEMMVVKSVTQNERRHGAMVKKKHSLAILPERMQCDNKPSLAKELEDTSPRTIQIKLSDMF